MAKSMVGKSSSLTKYDSVMGVVSGRVLVFYWLRGMSDNLSDAEFLRN